MFAMFFHVYIGVPNVSVPFKMVFSMNLKEENTVNMIFMFYLHHAVTNVVNLLLVVSLKLCQLIGIPIVSVANYVQKNWLIVVSFVIRYNAIFFFLFLYYNNTL